MFVKWPESYGVPYENANVTKGESVFNLSPDMMKMYTQYIWLSELTSLMKKISIQFNLFILYTTSMVQEIKNKQSIQTCMHYKTYN